MATQHRNWLGTAAAIAAGTFFGARAAVRYARRFDLDGRVVLITGGSRGLGLLMAREFAQRGARVAACARDDAELAHARQILARDGLELWTRPCDVTDRAQVERLVGEVRQELGHPDVLVNNAGVIGIGPVGSMTLADYHKAMDVNFYGAIHVTEEVLPGMRRRARGRIVNVASIGGKVPMPHLLPYVASKFALTGWSAGLRAEIQQDGVYVTTVTPGLMRTGSPPNVDVKGQFEDEYAWFAVSDSTPGLSINARRAARRVVRACVNGEGEVSFPLNATLAIRAAGLFPGLTSEMLALVNRFLPAETGSTATRKGYESRGRSPHVTLTARGDRAAIENNELG